jgi:hypothetical protein
MKFGIKHQESYSRGELLLRTFFGMLYILLPHAFLLLFVLIGSLFLNFLTFWIILFSGKFPPTFFNYQLNLQRWNLRVMARFSNLSDGYPSFGLSASDENTWIELECPESSSRGKLLLRFFLGFFYVYIPHVFCLYFLSIAASFVRFIAWWIVLFTGKYPAGMHGFSVGVMRWAFRVSAYMGYLTDTYPPFSLEEEA